MISSGVKKIIPQSVKNIYHLFQAVLANALFGFPSRKMKVVGVTGTNGKTTTVQMISRVLEAAGHKVAVASTINFRIGEREWVNTTKFTTLSSWRLQRHLRKAVQAGCGWAVIEVTSHALDQNRVWGIGFSVAVLTNVTREHLDYHGTMKKYAETKEKLFETVAKNPEGVSVVNLNSKFAEGFLRHGAKKKYGYTTRSHESAGAIRDLETIKADDIRLGVGKSEFVIRDSKFVIHMPGEFNVENALAAACVSLSQGIGLEKISEALAEIRGVPGRMQKIRNNRNLEIIVDYALTPDSLQKLYDYIVRLKKEGSRIIAVFGSCGERDKGKRPVMGEVVAERADCVIVTNEDPYGEDPRKIIDAVFRGVEKHKEEGENSWRILDRREAIKKALLMAKPGDIVVITGKGAEETMAIGAKRIPWNDPKVIREVLRELQ